MLFRPPVAPLPFKIAPKEAIPPTLRNTELDICDGQTPSSHMRKNAYCRNLNWSWEDLLLMLLLPNKDEQ